MRNKSKWISLISTIILLILIIIISNFKKTEYAKCNLELASITKFS